MTTCEPKLSLNTGNICSMLDDTTESSVVLDRELEQERDPSDPRIRCPLCGWSPRTEDRWFVTADTNGTRSRRELHRHPCMFADFRNQVWEGNFPLEVNQEKRRSMCSE